MWSRTDTKVSFKKSLHYVRGVEAAAVVSEELVIN